MIIWIVKGNVPGARSQPPCPCGAPYEKILRSVTLTDQYSGKVKWSAPSKARWAEIFKIPVPVLAATYYNTILTLLVRWPPSKYYLAFMGTCPTCPYNMVLNHTFSPKWVTFCQHLVAIYNYNLSFSLNDLLYFNLKSITYCYGHCSSCQQIETFEFILVFLNNLLLFSLKNNCARHCHWPIT